MDHELCINHISCNTNATYMVYTKLQLIIFQQTGAHCVPTLCK